MRGSRGTAEGGPPVSYPALPVHFLWNLGSGCVSYKERDGGGREEEEEQSRAESEWTCLVLWRGVQRPTSFGISSHMWWIQECHLGQIWQAS